MSHQPGHYVDWNQRHSDVENFQRIAKFIALIFDQGLSDFGHYFELNRTNFEYRKFMIDCQVIYVDFDVKFSHSNVW